MWAVGYFEGQSGWETLIEHYGIVCTTPTPSPPPSRTPTQTPTFTRTPTPAGTLTPTRTPTPSPPLVGHVTWQGPPAQPNPRQVLSGTLTLCSGTDAWSYTVTTDASGSFTLTIGLPPVGSYRWLFKGSRWLATSGMLTLGASRTNVEMGLQRAGDANNDNTTNAQDYTIVRNAFGFIGPGVIDARADFDNDSRVTISDFNLLRGNFGASGAAVNCP